ncbi:nucleotidyltransferase domain-containing protein [Paenibacillus ferrarius]|uniref:nucleotidyltransferase domain-containing protein n=1 Tax=Paenibacillus ferrarius TaxID=1469647 RepID=UPI003D2DDEC0
MSLQEWNLSHDEIAAASTDDLLKANIVADRIKSLLGDQLRKVILFGSRARGDAREDSDFDFIVIADFTEPSWIERGKQLRKHVNATRELDIDVDYLPMTDWEFENKFMFARAVREEGVVLYEKRNTALDR